MDSDSAPDDLRFAFLLVAIVYGVALAVVGSSIAGLWSGLHLVATLGLLVVGGPVLLVQALLLRSKRSLAPGYNLVFWLSLGFPVGLVLLGLVVSRADG